jgi:2-oxoglutarate dehydrogenase E2 component (dihydrolipoamide succinyltransferase)
MRHKVRVPPAADGALAVTIVAWLKDVGDEVTQGEDLVEATTEKINLYVIAPANGKLVEILSPVGEQARVGDVIGLVEEA